MSKQKSMKEILEKNRHGIAFIIGNGANRYRTAKKANSWHDLLVQLADKHMPSEFKQIPEGVSLTEFYDMIELKTPNTKIEKTLQQKFCDLMSSWKPFKHHERIIAWAQQNDSPVLTTNYDRVFADAGHLELLRTIIGGFTDYYPWENYYGNKEITDPSKEFGVWHINGLVHYHQSIRLGLTHYMGSVERARRLIYKSKGQKLFSGNNINWQGNKSWLHIIFNTPLLMFGLGLEENEVFLRWLLIERARYFKKFPNRKTKAWYVHSKSLDNPGKSFFLDGVGIKAVQVEGYDEIYGPKVWD
jgi:hypothetical protein